MRCMRVVPSATAIVPAQGSSTSAKLSVPLCLRVWLALQVSANHVLVKQGFRRPRSGRNPAHTASQVGTSNWASRKVCSHSRTAVKLGPSWCMRLLTMTSATSGCLFFTLGMQSAQLAQWAASTLPAARHNPSSPKFEGTPAALRALSEPPAIPTNWQKHVHSALSWACEKASDSGGRTMRRSTPPRVLAPRKHDSTLVSCRGGAKR